MPIDPSIPLQARNIKFQMPQEVEANSLRNLAMQQQLQQGQQGMEDKNALRQLLSQASQGGPVDYGKLGQALLPYDSNAGLHFMQMGEQQNQQKQWQERQRGMAPSPQPGMPQAPQPPGAMSPGPPPVPGQPPGQQQVSGVFSMYRDNPNPGVVQLAKNGELRLQQGGFKSEEDFNKYMDTIGQLDAKYQETRGAAAERVQAAKDAAQERRADRLAQIEAAKAGRAPREARTQLREGENGPEMVNMDTGQSTPIIDKTTGQRLAAKPGSDKPLTESQGKATGMAMRAQEAHDTLNQLSAQGASMPGLIKQGADAVGLGAAANWTQSGPQQKVEQAQRNFVNAALRVESGASISESEFANAKKQYFPQPGDRPEVIAQKQRNRESEIESLKVQGGAGAKHVESKPPADPLTVINPADGKAYKFPTQQQADAARRAAGIK